MSELIETGFEEAFAALEAVKVKQEKINPVERLMTLRNQGAGTKTLFAAMNKNYAAVKWGSKIGVASIVGKDVDFMNEEDFHRTFANLVIYKGDDIIKVSKHWFGWPGRRQFLARGVVFEPGGPLEIPNDMLNLWRGFGIVPKLGDWSLMRAHIFNVVCSGNQNHYNYLIHWMAYAVQHPHEPIGVAVALLGAQGAGKDIVARTFGKFFGKHFAHITHGNQLTGRFNASLGTSCAVFLDEALWAGDKQGEGVLKGLITEPRLQMEAKFRDPIMVENRLRIIVASNSDWAVPTGIGDRRWFVLNVANTYAGTGHRDYWTALYPKIENGAAAAMLHELLAMDLTGFDVRAVPHTAAKAQQQELSLRGTPAWLCHVLQEGAIGYEKWNEAGLTTTTDRAYENYEEFSKKRREWQPETKAVWSRNIHAVLDPNVKDTRPTIANERVRSFQFASLADCRRQFASHLCAPELIWQEPDNEPEPTPGEAVQQSAEDVGEPTVSDTLDDAPSIEWEPDLEPDPDYWPRVRPRGRVGK